VGDWAGHLLLAEVVLVSVLWLVSVSEAPVGGGLTYRVTPQTFLSTTYSYAHNDQSFGGARLRDRTPYGPGEPGPGVLVNHRRQDT